MTKISAAILITLGSFTEIWFYILRFQQDGTETWLSTIIAAALTLFLAALTLLRHQNRWAIPAAFALAAYSVFCTTAGQSAALGLIQNERSQEDAQQAIAVDAIADYRQNIDRLDREEEDIRERIASMTTDDIAYWTTRGIEPFEDRKNAIAAERQEWQDRIDAERDTLTTHEAVERTERNVYAFYASVIGGDPRVIQIILQVVLSVFIAMMAPTGIIMLTLENREPEPEIEPEETVDPEFARQARSWAWISWHGIRAEKSDRLMALDAVKRAADSKDLRNDLFETILDESVSRGIVSIRDDGYYVPAVSEAEAVIELCGG